MQESGWQIRQGKGWKGDQQQGGGLEDNEAHGGKLPGCLGNSLILSCESALKEGGVAAAIATRPARAATAMAVQEHNAKAVLNASS